MPRSLSHADCALMAAALGPLVSIGLLALIGFSVGAALCATFVLAFAVTTAMDLRWFLRSRRSRNDVCGSRS